MLRIRTLFVPRNCVAYVHVRVHLSSSSHIHLCAHIFDIPHSSTAYVRVHGGSLGDPVIQFAACITRHTNHMRYVDVGWVQPSNLNSGVRKLFLSDDSNTVLQNSVWPSVFMHNSWARSWTLVEIRTLVWLLMHYSWGFQTHCSLCAVCVICILYVHNFSIYSSHL